MEKDKQFWPIRIWLIIAGLLLFGQEKEIFFQLDVKLFLIISVIFWWGAERMSSAQYADSPTDISFLSNRTTSFAFFSGSIAAMIALAMIAIQLLILNPDLSVNIYRILDLSPTTLFSLSALMILQFGIFRLSLRQIRLIKALGYSHQDFLKNLVLLHLVLIPVFWLLRLNYSPLIFAGLSIGFQMILYYLIPQKTNPIQYIVTIVFIGGFLNAFLAFSVHEENNKTIHLDYARQLANNSDSIAERQMMDMSAAIAEKATFLPDQSFAALVEKEWVNNDYLFRNYRLEFLSEEDSSRVKNTPPGKPVLQYDSGLPFYSLVQSVPETSDSMLFLAFYPIWHQHYSNYSKLAPFKNIPQLEAYRYALFRNGNLAIANTHDFDDGYDAFILPAANDWQKIEQNNYDAIIYHHPNGNVVIIGEPFSEVGIWFSLFAFFFSLAALVKSFLLLISVAGNKDSGQRWRQFPIQLRMQTVTLALVTLIFAVVGIATFWFLKSNNDSFSNERRIAKAEVIKDELFHEIGRFGLPETVESKVKISTLLYHLASQQKADLDLYNEQGELLSSSHTTFAENSRASSRIEPALVTWLQENPRSFSQNVLENYQCTIIPVALREDTPTTMFVAMSINEKENSSASDIPIILSSLLNVYVLLLMLAGAVAFILTKQLIKPIRLIAARLGEFKLGQEHDPLHWESEDSIGLLVKEYNLLSQKLNESVKELAKVEREGAWQSMAQQIAHEINNPLTPIRLNIQYLMHAFGQTPGADTEKLSRISNTLIEKVDHLSRIASQFSLFAKMERPHTENIDIISFTEQFGAANEQQDGSEFSLELPEERPLMVAIDPGHLHQVLQNLMNNAMEAIPDDRAGEITLRVKSEDDYVVIELTDNGGGVPEELQNKIFEPQFSTQNSGTGLGLAICRRIIEFYEGRLGFETEAGKGSCFYLILKKAPVEVLSV